MLFAKKVSLKETQQLLLNLLKIVDTICRDNNIEYWIDGGTFLGVTRNNKFIDWDDDIDICLMPDDYQKLLSILKSKKDYPSKNIFLFNNYRPIPHWSSYLADSSILKKGNLPYKIDILSVKSVPNNPEVLKDDKSIINFSAYFFKGKFKYSGESTNEHLDLFIKNTSVIKQRSKYVSYLNSYVKELNKLDKTHLYTYPFNDIYVSREREYYTYDDIFPLKDVDFEGVKVMAPNNSKSYLTKLYGADYLTPPPVNKQIPASSKMVAKNVPNFVIKANIYITYLLKEIKYIAKRILTRQ